MKYEITATSIKYIDIDADSEEEAIEKAINELGDSDFLETIFWKVEEIL